METAESTGARVFLIDDHPAMRNGLCLLLTQAGHTVCGEAGSRAEVLERIGTAKADVALVDLSLAEESGLELLDALAACDVAMLIYSMHEDRASIGRALGRGAQGYVTKREVADVLLAAIGAVRAGERYISPRASQSLGGPGLAADGLSPREEQIMAMLGRGETNDEIADTLGISAHTVQTYFARMIEKLALGGMKELRKRAITGQR